MATRTITEDRDINAVLRGRIASGHLEPMQVQDTKVRALRLHISAGPEPVCTWHVRYRTKTGIQRRLNLGKLDVVGLSAAREQAKKALGAVAAGGDPRQDEIDKRQAVQAAREAARKAERHRIETVCEDYLEKHAKPHKKSWRQDADIIQRVVLRRWRGRPIGTITRAALREALEDIYADAPVSALRARALLSRVWRFAREHELIESNIVRDLATLQHTSTPVERYSADELKRIWTNTATLGVLEQAAIRLTLLTGQRPNEVLRMTWDELDLRGGWWTIPAERSKNGRAHRVPLGTLAKKILRKVPRVDGEVHVFAGTLAARAQREANRVAFAGVGARPKPRHSLRASVASGLAEWCKVPMADIAAVLNHAEARHVVTAGYQQYAHDEEKAEALRKWEDWLIRLTRRKTAAASKVVAFRR